MIRYLVWGTGVGKAIAYHLLVYGGRDVSVVLADRLLPIAEIAVFKVARALGRFDLDQIKLKPQSLDANAHNFESEVSRFDVVVSALPARYSFRIAKAAVKTGRDFCDLGGVVEETRRLSELNEEAERAGVSLLLGCGFMPGTGDILSRMLVERLDETDSVLILAGGLPQKPRPPLYYQKVFSLEGLEHLCYDPIPVLEDGEIKWKEPFSGYERRVVPELAGFSNGSGRIRGQVEEFNTAGASLLPWTLRELGIKNFAEKTVRWPGFVDFVRYVPRDKFVQMLEPLIDIPVNASNPDLAWIKVQAQGYVSKHPLVSSFTALDIYDAVMGFTAMERVTGFPTAILAKMMAEGKVKKGAHTPDQALDKSGREHFLTELKKHFQITEK